MTTVLPFKVSFFLKIAFRTLHLADLMIIGQGVLSVCFFPSLWDLLMSLIDTFSLFLVFLFQKISIITSPVISFTFAFTPWIRRQKICFEICLSFYFISSSISSNFSWICLALLTWTSFVEEENIVYLFLQILQRVV